MQKTKSSLPIVINQFTNSSNNKIINKVNLVFHEIWQSKTTKIAINSILFASILNITNSQSVSAITINLKPDDLGWYSENGFHFSDNTNYLAGDCRGEIGGCLKVNFNMGNETRNFFVFDTSLLQNIQGNFTEAKLKLEIPSSDEFPGFLSPTNSELYQLNQVLTEIDELIAGSGYNNPKPSIFQDLGNGLTYNDPFGITNNDLGNFVTIPLNQNALDTLNNQPNDFVLGGKITTLDNTQNDEYSFGFTHDAFGLVSANPVELKLEISSISLNAIDRGWYSETGIHFPENNNYIAGDCRGEIGGCLDANFDVGEEFRSFFVFDLPELQEPISYAAVRLEIPGAGEFPGFESPTNLEFFQLAEVNTSIEELIAGGSVENPRPDIFEALGIGTKYSDEIRITNDDLGKFLEIILNEDGINAINSATEKFAISGANTSLNNSIDDEFIFGFTHSTFGFTTPSSTQLILSDIPFDPTLNNLSINYNAESMINAPIPFIGESELNNIDVDITQNSGNNNPQSQSTSEPNTLLGIVGLGIFGAIFKKNKHK